MALEACEVYERLGTPEGELAIAQAVVFLACTAKSNAVYAAFGEAMEDAKKLGSLEVPLHLRKARLTRTSLDANTGICHGMLRHSYPTDGQGEEPSDRPPTTQESTNG